MKTGSKIEGYWAFWPFHGAQYARRFETLEDAEAYLPISKKNKGRKIPLGNKLITRVSHDGAWTFDLVANFTQEQIDERYLNLAEEVVGGA
jgi:hypothetical protein